MKYIFVDLEFTSDENEIKIDEREIISIGAIKCDKKGNVIDTYYSLVKPQINSNLTDFCIKFTNIKQEDINTARNTSEVLLEFYSWVYSRGNKVKIFSWGYMDGIILRKEIERNTLDISLRCLNVQIQIHNFLRKLLLVGNNYVSLDKTKIIFNLNGRVKHNALSDAIDLKDVFFKYLKVKKSNKDNIRKIDNKIVLHNI